MRKTPLLLLPVALVMLAACQPKTPAEPAATPAAKTPAAPAPVEAPAAPAPTATAMLQPTQGHQTSGSITFAVVDGGIRATGEVRGLPPGTEHGFHVHEKGDCSAPDAMSAGGHFNPATTEHGRVGHGVHHGGDSDNILANEQGVAMVDTLLQDVTLGDGAATDIVGRSLLVLGATPGAISARGACAVITAAH